jgi:hypothetical protein
VFPGHAVKTVSEAGWRTSKDGPLLDFAQRHFDVFLTVDRKLEREHDLSSFRLGFVIARVRNNRLDGFEPILSGLRAAVDAARPGEVIWVIDPALA